MGKGDPWGVSSSWRTNAPVFVSRQGSWSLSDTNPAIPSRMGPMLPAVANCNKHTFGGFLVLGLTPHFHVGVSWTTWQVTATSRIPPSGCVLTWWKARRLSRPSFVRALRSHSRGLHLPKAPLYHCGPQGSSYGFWKNTSTQIIGRMNGCVKWSFLPLSARLLLFLCSTQVLQTLVWILQLSWSYFHAWMVVQIDISVRDSYWKLLSALLLSLLLLTYFLYFLTLCILDTLALGGLTDPGIDYPSQD